MRAGSEVAQPQATRPCSARAPRAPCRHRRRSADRRRATLASPRAHRLLSALPVAEHDELLDLRAAAPAAGGAAQSHRHQAAEDHARALSWRRRHRVELHRARRRASAGAACASRASTRGSPRARCGAPVRPRTRSVRLLPSTVTRSRPPFGELASDQRHLRAAEAHAPGRAGLAGAHDGAAPRVLRSRALPSARELEKAAVAVVDGDQHRVGHDRRRVQRAVRRRDAEPVGVARLAAEVQPVRRAPCRAASSTRARPGSRRRRRPPRSPRPCSSPRRSRRRPGSPTRRGSCATVRPGWQAGGPAAPRPMRRSRTRSPAACCRSTCTAPHPAGRRTARRRWSGSCRALGLEAVDALVREGEGRLPVRAGGRAADGRADSGGRRSRRRSPAPEPAGPWPQSPGR